MKCGFPAKVSRLRCVGGSHWILSGAIQMGSHSNLWLLHDWTINGTSLARDDGAFDLVKGD